MTDITNNKTTNAPFDFGVESVVPTFVPTIHKNGFILRAVRIKDAADMVLNINTLTIDKNTTIGLPLSLDRAKWWLAHVCDASGRQKEEHFAIEINKELVGTIGLINIDGHKCEIGYWLNEKYVGKGVMSAALAEVVQYGFETLGLLRIFAPVLTHNKASARVLQKNGFELEGTLKKFYLKGGKYIDALSYSLVPSPSGRGLG